MVRSVEKREVDDILADNSLLHNSSSEVLPHADQA